VSSARLPGVFIDHILPVLRRYDINSVYLFGSRADDTASLQSDYDLGILLRGFDAREHDTLFVCMRTGG